MAEISKDDTSMEPEEVEREELSLLRRYLNSRPPVNLGDQLVTLPGGRVVKQREFYKPPHKILSGKTERGAGRVALGLDFHYQHAPDRNPQVFQPVDTTD